MDQVSLRIATIVLLVEDIGQENLLRRFLQRLGQNNRNIRVNRLSKGVGSGEQHVREKYASEVRSLRRRAGRIRSCLIAMIDADADSTQSRRTQFDRALSDGDEPPRKATEPILQLIAKRNVETWILWLHGESVDELTNYRQRNDITATTIKTAAERLYALTRPNASVPPDCLPSLKDSLPEFLRIPD